MWNNIYVNSKKQKNTKVHQRISLNYLKPEIALKNIIYKVFFFISFKMKYENFKVKGQAVGAMSAALGLVVTVGIAVVIHTFIGTLSGQTFELVESDIDAITNTTIKTYVKEGIAEGFNAYAKTGQYLPLIVLAVVIGVVITVVLGIAPMGGMGGSGNAL